MMDDEMRTWSWVMVDGMVCHESLNHENHDWERWKGLEDKMRSLIGMIKKRQKECSMKNMEDTMEAKGWAWLIGGGALLLEGGKACVRGTLRELENPKILIEF